MSVIYLHRSGCVVSWPLPWQQTSAVPAIAVHQQHVSDGFCLNTYQIMLICREAGLIVKCDADTGDERPGQRASDMVIIIDEKAHPVFRREGNDLHYTYRLPLADALCGPTMRVPTLDGRQLEVVMEGVAHPNAVKVVKGEGMPISKAPGTKGDLRIHFDIVFPKSLSPQQKTAIRANLPAR